MLFIDAKIGVEQLGDFLSTLVEQGAWLVGWNTVGSDEFLYVQVMVSVQD